MGSSRNRYSREFKVETVRNILETGQSQTEVARELDIRANTVSRWKRQYQVEQKEAFPGTGRQTSSAALVAYSIRSPSPSRFGDRFLSLRKEFPSPSHSRRRNRMGRDRKYPGSYLTIQPLHFDS